MTDRFHDNPRRRAELTNAARAAGEITGQSAVIRQCVSGMIAATRLYAALRAVVDNELQQAWDVVNPELVGDVLGQAARRQSAQPYTIAELAESLRAVGELVHILALQEQEKSAEDAPAGDAESVDEEKTVDDAIHRSDDAGQE